MTLAIHSLVALLDIYMHVYNIINYVLNKYVCLSFSVICLSRIFVKGVNLSPASITTHLLPMDSLCSCLFLYSCHKSKSFWEVCLRSVLFAAPLDDFIWQFDSWFSTLFFYVQIQLSPLTGLGSNSADFLTEYITCLKNPLCFRIFSTTFLAQTRNLGPFWETCSQNSPIYF